MSPFHLLHIPPLRFDLGLSLPCRLLLSLLGIFAKFIEVDGREGVYVRPNVFIEREHCEFVAFEQGLHFFVEEDLAPVIGVLEVVGFDVVPESLDYLRPGHLSALTKKAGHLWTNFLDDSEPRLLALSLLGFFIGCLLLVFLVRFIFRFFLVIRLLVHGVQYLCQCGFNIRLFGGEVRPAHFGREESDELFGGDRFQINCFHEGFHFFSDGRLVWDGDGSGWNGSSSNFGHGGLVPVISYCSYLSCMRVKRVRVLCSVATWIMSI
mmetsp:Transcript_6223/g.7696  ORF Transcript_6223/g.7696 Transcript_6223/m.7696 type:complete len:265 (+) Transcript_6223:531-1325(+)